MLLMLGILKPDNEDDDDDDDDMFYKEIIVPFNFLLTTDLKGFLIADFMREHQFLIHFDIFIIPSSSPPMRVVMLPTP